MIPDGLPARSTQIFRSARRARRVVLPVSQAMSGQAGMRLRARIPVFVFRKGSGAESPPLQYHLSDNKGIFRGGRLAGFLS
jgi:hypothetical protein